MEDFDGDEDGLNQNESRIDHGGKEHRGGHGAESDVVDRENGDADADDDEQEDLNQDVERDMEKARVNQTVGEVAPQLEVNMFVIFAKYCNSIHHHHHISGHIFA